MKYLSVILTTLYVTGSQAATIDWELRHPLRQFAAVTGKDLRYFDDKDSVRNSWEYRRDLYWTEDCKDEAEPIVCAERRLGSTRLSAIEKLVASPPGELRSRYGPTKSRAWLSEALHGSGNRYSAGSMRYSDKIVQPRPQEGGSRTLAAWLFLRGGDVARKQCVWNVDGAQLDSPVPCDARVRFGLKRGSDTSTIKVTLLPDGVTLKMDGEDTKIEEVLIAGIGDSYAAGEGAPTIPAKVKFKMESKRPDVTRISARSARYAQADNAAHWAERNCHRSFLSSQMRAAIYMAASKPKVETTFVHLACSGAEIETGLLGNYSGSPETNGIKRSLQRPRNRNGTRSLSKRNVARTTISQINELVRLLCNRPKTTRYEQAFSRYLSGRVERQFSRNFDTLPFDNPFMGELGCTGGFKRKLDAILVSIGGNDAGFANVIMHALVSDFESFGLTLVGRPPLSPTKAAKNLPGLGQKYKRLNNALRSRLPLKSGPGRIIISQYPRAVHDRDGQPCATGDGLGALDALRVRRPFVSKRESRRISTIFAKPLNNTIKNAASENGWSLAKPSPNSFARGWCAGGIVLKTEKTFNPYALTRRWTRTPDDARVIIDYKPGLGERRRARRISDLLSGVGAFHPNGLGAAGIAEGYRVQLQKLPEYR